MKWYDLDRFYTYTYFIDGIPRYVGKGTHCTGGTGTAERCLSHIKDRPSSDWEQFLAAAILKGCEYYIITNDHYHPPTSPDSNDDWSVKYSHDDTLIEEGRLIRLYGRQKDGGTLFNRSLGMDIFALLARDERNGVQDDRLIALARKDHD